MLLDEFWRKSKKPGPKKGEFEKDILELVFGWAGWKSDFLQLLVSVKVRGHSVCLTFQKAKWLFH